LFRFTSLRFTRPHFTSTCFTSPHFTGPCFTSPHFGSPRFAGPRFAGPVQSGPVLEVQCAVFVSTLYLLDNHTTIKVISHWEANTHEGYCTVARRSEFYFQVGTTILRTSAASEALLFFSSGENKIDIFKPPCYFAQTTL